MNVGYTHASNEIWGLSADAAHYDALASTLALREQLRPYTAALVAEVVAAGTPMLRPLFWEFPWDANVTTGVNAAPGSEFSFMYGAEYLVAPVVVEGANFSSVYLPRPLPGFTWHYLFNATEVAGGQLAVVDVRDIGVFPVFHLTADGTEPPAPPKKTWADFGPLSL